MKKLFPMIFVTLILVIVLSSALFLSLYLVDNKYNPKAAQAIDGELYLSKEDWTSTPIRYLWDGWRFYDNLLLTPASLKQQGDDYQYLSITKASDFAMGDSQRSPHGSASYAMTLNLPQEAHTYAIELPEIYSAYRLYIDDELKLQVGQPDANTYQDQIQYRMVTFQASGKTSLLLNVSNHTWIHGGLLSPPTFGDPLNINLTRALRVGLSLITITATLMTAVLALYVAIRNRHKNNLLIFALLCMATAIFLSYPIVHSILSLAIQPWFSIELASGYMVTLILLLLHNRMCDTQKHAQAISVSTAAMMYLLVLLYGLFAAHLTFPVMLAYASLVFAFRLFVAAYLILTAFMAVNKNIQKALILFCADIIYACAFIWDRLLPNYDPIIGRWFQEWGILSLVITMGLLLWHDIAMEYRHNFLYKEEQHQLKRQLNMQVEHLRQMNQKIEESAKLHHDFRHHLRTLLTLCQQGHREELSNYIRGITDINEGNRLARLTENIQLDALVQYYKNLAESNGIVFRSKLQLPATLNFPIVDLCGLLGNLLENAVEACQRQQVGEKTIYMAGRLQNNQLEFVLDNSFQGEVKRIGRKYLSSKRSGFGLGLSSVFETVERYDGVINIYAKDNVFHAEISLPNGNSISPHCL